MKAIVTPRTAAILPRLLALALMAALLSPPPALSQEVSGTIRGQVASDSGAPLAGVRVLAQSPTLTRHRETIADAHGQYVLALLPPGEYVVTFEGMGLVTVKHVTRMSPLETIVADAVMVAADNPEELITTSIAPQSFARAPAASEALDNTALERLPVEGSLFSVLTLTPGPTGARATDAFVTLDGSPVRFLRTGDEPPLLNPGALSFQEATAIVGSAPTEITRFRSGVVAAATRAGGNHLTGAVKATLTTADRLGDAVEGARDTRDEAGGVEFGVGVPLLERRWWAFVSGRHQFEPVDSRARFTSTAHPARTTERLWEIKTTHALHPDHRVEAHAFIADRERRGAPPLGAVSIEESSAREDRDHSHRLVSAAYSGLLGRALQVTARLSAEQLRIRTSADPRSPIAAIWDHQTGAVLGGSCPDCAIDDRASATWRVSIRRPVSLLSNLHDVTVGVERGNGRIEFPGIPGVTLLASRLVVDRGTVYPVLESNGSSWLVRQQGQPVRPRHTSDGMFVTDEWRHGSNLLVHAGMRWDRQRLATPGATQPVLIRSGFSPRLQVSWQPVRDDSWTLSAGIGRYEAELLHVLGERIEPSGEWFVYRGPSINAGPASALIGSTAVVEQATNWLQADSDAALLSGTEAPISALAGLAPSGLSPTLEWTVGTSRRIGDEIRLRADFLWRRSRPLEDEGAQGELPAFGAAPRFFERPDKVDLGLLTRRYTALALQAHYEVGIQAAIVARYTLSHLRGEHDDRPAMLPVADWSAPPGDLAGDRRHQLRLWGHVDFFESESRGTAGIAVLQTLESERPYGIVSWIDLAPWMPEPTTRRAPLVVPYYFTARDHLRSKAALRTDMLAKYSRPIPGTLRSEVVVQLHVLNLFNKRRVRNPEAFAVARTAFTDPSRFAPFNPLAEVPQLGVHWDTDQYLATALDNAETTMSRAYRVSVGVRF